MNNRFRTILLILASASSALAFRSIGDVLSLTPESSIWLEGTSTIRSYKCSTKTLQATIDASADAVRAVLSGDKAVRTVQLVVPEKSLECGNGTMNSHMLEALKEKEHADITFKLVSYELAKADSGASGTLNGVLNINGTDQTIALPVQLRAASGGMLRVTGKYELNMKDYGVKPPSLMLGTMKVAPKVTVNFDLLLKS